MCRNKRIIMCNVGNWLRSYGGSDVDLQSRSEYCFIVRRKSSKETPRMKYRSDCFLFSSARFHEKYVNISLYWVIPVQTVKSHVRNDCTTSIICPVCNRAKSISVAVQKNKKNALKVRCRCKTVFKVQLNYRSHYRKLVRLSGRYETLHQYHYCKGHMNITNLSQVGLQFSIADVNRLEPGYVLTLNFQLDNKQQTPIKMCAMVRSIHNNVIGCEFIVQEVVNRPLAFYLLRWNCNPIPSKSLHYPFQTGKSHNFLSNISTCIPISSEKWELLRPEW